VEVKWYSTVKWFVRFQQIKAENWEKLPESTRKYLDKFFVRLG
jgi:hypothetical protein